MRLSPLAPETLSPELREVHDGIAALIARSQERIVVLDAHGRHVRRDSCLTLRERGAINSQLSQG